MFYGYFEATLSSQKFTYLPTAIMTRRVPRIIFALLIAGVWCSRAHSQNWVVNNSDDNNDGACDAVHCSLREAIRAANLSPGPDTIRFNIPGAGPHVISPNTSLPSITGAGTVIDGSTQPAFFPGAIVLNGGGAGVPIDGIEINAPNCAIYGLHIRRFPNGIIVSNAANARIGAPGNKGNIIGGNSVNGIQITGIASTNTIIQNNLIGLFPNGNSPDPNPTGILLDGQTLGAFSNTQIGGSAPQEGNVISGNTLDAIFARSTLNSRILGNIIGLNATQDAALPNGRHGVALINCSNPTIGNATGGGNLIMGNGGNGITLNTISNGARIEGNAVGAFPTGATVFGNAGHGLFASAAAFLQLLENTVAGNGASGVEILQSHSLVIRSNFIGVNAADTPMGNRGDGLSLTNCTSFNIDNNVVSANTQHGLSVQMLPAIAPVNGMLTANRIGTNTAGNLTLGNNGYGIRITQVSNLLLGGSQSEGNVVAANGLGGILLGGVLDVILENNAIGTNPSGTLNLGNNGNGIAILQMSDGVLVGGAGAGNIIAFNRGAGVLVGSPSTACTISQNSIFCNQIGIDLDPGANDDMPSPHSICATPAGINGQAQPFAKVELFRHSHDGCIAPPCQGRHFVAETLADAAGHWAISTALSLGDTLTATATNLAGSTSEFSACILVQTAPVIEALNSGPICPGDTVNLIGTVNPPLPGTVYAWTGPNNFTSTAANPVGAFAEGRYVLRATQGFCRSEPDTTEVRFWPIPTGQLIQTLCPGQSVTVNGRIYDASNPSGTEILSKASVHGCDSIVQVQLSYFAPATGLFQTTLCPGGAVTVNGTVYDVNRPAGTEIFAGASTNGCDSTVSVQVSFFPPATGSFQTTLCPGGSVTVNGTVYDASRPSGTEIFRNATVNGCDSTVSVQVSFFPPATGSFQTTLCPGGSVTVNGTVYDASRPSGTEIFRNAAVNGCDSTVSVQVSFFPPATGSFQTTLCPGGSVVVNGTVYDANRTTGTEILPGASVNGCDSILSVQIDFYPPAIGRLQHGICPDEVVIVNGQAYNRNRLNGTEVLAGRSARGCDSTVIVDLFVLPVPEFTLEQTICPGTLVLVNGVAYGENRTTGTEILRNAAANGCDSIVHIRLTVDTLLLEVRLRAANCSPQERGNITLFSIEGGTAPYAVGLDGVQFTSITNFPFVIDHLAAGRYMLHFRDFFGCIYREAVVIPDNPLFDIRTDTVIQIRRGDPVVLGYGFDFIPDFIRWLPADGLSCTNCLNPEALPLFSTTYRMEAEFFGCKARQTVQILVDTRLHVYAPTGFSPNEDGYNDHFTLFADAREITRIVSLRIFDRWGELVFEGRDLEPGNLDQGWDGKLKGKPCPTGQYVFAAWVESAYAELVEVKGSFALLR